MCLNKKEINIHLPIDYSFFYYFEFMGHLIILLKYVLKYT